MCLWVGSCLSGSVGVGPTAHRVGYTDTEAVRKASFRAEPLQPSLGAREVPQL